MCFYGGEGSLITLNFPEEPFVPFEGDKDLLCASLGLGGTDVAEFMGQNRMDAFVSSALRLRVMAGSCYRTMRLEVQ